MLAPILMRRCDCRACLAHRNAYRSGRVPLAARAAALVSVLLVSAMNGCRDRAAAIRRDPEPVVDAAPPTMVSVNATAPLPPNPAIDCFAWLNDEDSRAFPHPIEPGMAIGLVLEWADRHHAAKTPSVLNENVHCPRSQCVAPEDCWYRIRLDDAAATTVSHWAGSLEVHARTGEVRWEEVGPDGGLVARVEPPSKATRVPLPASVMKH